VVRKYVKRFATDSVKRTKKTWQAIKVNESFLEGRSRVFFLHYPKCAGISISSAFINCLRTWGYHDFRHCRELSASASASAARMADSTIPELRKSILHYWLSDYSLRFVRGHFWIEKDILAAYRDDWKFMTVLREPVERWISWYFYDRYKESDHGKIALSLDEFLSTDRAKNMGKDYASMILGEQRFQSGRRKESELGAAKSVLSRFDMVETVNRMSELEKRVAEKFGWKINVGKKNKNPTNKKKKK
jgi:hypothetical protein